MIESNKSYFNILIILLLFSIAISAQFTIKAHYWNYYYPEIPVTNYSDILLYAFPKQLKRFGAGILRLRADEYMHVGPSKKVKENFIAGCFAGNTEIMGLLKFSLYLDPTDIDTYTVMSQNLAMYLDRYKDAIRLIQKGILANKNSVELHKLYSAGAYCYGFAESYTSAGNFPVKNDRAVALNYLEAAIKSYKANAHRMTKRARDAFANIDNYYILKSRFLLDIGKEHEALKAWRNVPGKLQNGFLNDYFKLLEKDTDIPDSPKKLFKKNFLKQQIDKYKEKLSNSFASQKNNCNLKNAKEKNSQNLASLNPLLVQGNKMHEPENNKQNKDIYSTKQKHAGDYPHAFGHEHNSRHNHNQASTCSHCNASTWKLLVQSRDTMFQALIMFIVAIIIRKFS